MPENDFNRKVVNGASVNFIVSTFSVVARTVSGRVLCAAVEDEVVVDVLVVVVVIEAVLVLT